MYGLSGVLILTSQSPLAGQDPGSFELRLEAGPVWQSRNEVQIPNDQRGTRFSLEDLVGSGPWPAGRVYLTWNINPRHSLEALLAPLSVTGSGTLSEAVAFAGEIFEAGTPVEGTYRFNSWRIGYRYRLTDRPGLGFWIGFTAKLRDAEIRLRQGSTSARDTDLGFVPLLHLAADWRFARRGHLEFEFDGLAGGPGRAFDTGLRLGYELSDGWMVSAGYRTLEGGADVDTVYNFAWLHYGVLSLVIRP
jgi:hypothetical protein